MDCSVPDLRHNSLYVLDMGDFRSFVGFLKVVMRKKRCELFVIQISIYHVK